MDLRLDLLRWGRRNRFFLSGLLLLITVLTGIIVHHTEYPFGSSAFWTFVVLYLSVRVLRSHCVISNKIWAETIYVVYSFHTAVF